MKASPIYLLMFLCGMFGGYHFGQWNMPPVQAEIRESAVVIANCLGQPEWVIAAGTQGITILNWVDINPANFREWVKEWQPYVVKSPTEVCI